MWKDEAFLAKSKANLKDEYFENDLLGYFFNKTVKFYDRFEVAPNLNYFVNELRKIESEEKKKEYGITLHNILNATPVSEDYIKESLEDYIKRNKFVKMYEKIPDLYGRETESAYRFVQEKIEEISCFTFTDNEHISLEEAPKFIEDGSAPKTIVPIGIPDIDMALGGGVRDGDLCTFLGDSGVGKSIFLVKIGSQCLKKGLKVLHLNLEGRGAIPILRYASNLSSVPYTKIKSGDFEGDEEETYLNAIKLHSKRLYLIHASSFSVTIEDVYAKCKEIHKSFPFDVLIVDYGDLITTKGKMELRHQQTTVFRGLSRIAALFKVPVITASQATRPEKEFNSRSLSWITPRNMSESYEKVRVSSVILSINRSEIEEKENKVRIMLCKNRDGVKNIKVGCYSNYQAMDPYGLKYGFYEPTNTILSEGEMGSHL